MIYSTVMKAIYVAKGTFPTAGIPCWAISHIPVEKGYKIHIWGLINRYNKNHWVTTEKNINANFVFEQLEKRSFQIQKQTMIILDNASIHKATIIKQ